MINKSKRHLNNCNGQVKYITFVLALMGTTLWGTTLMGTTLWAQGPNISPFPEAPMVVSPDANLQSMESLNSLPISPSAQLPSADEFFIHAFQRIQSHSSIAASVEQSILIGNIQMLGVGKYYEKVENRKRLMRMEMKFDTGQEKPFEMIQVFDGRYYWNIRKISDKPDIKHRDSFKNDSFSSNADSMNIFGGLIKLMEQIQQRFKLDSLEKYINVEDKGEYWIVSGTWRSEKFPLKKYQDEQTGTIRWTDVPPEVPDYISIHFGAVDFFPYKIVYYRDLKNGNRKPMAVIQFSEVSFVCRLNEELFQFEPSSDERSAALPYE